jgi:hypothetical protein
MLRHLFYRGVLFVWTLSVATVAWGVPCTGVDRSLTVTRRQSLAPIISKHLQPEFGGLADGGIRLAPEDILQSFRVDRWHIIYVNSGVSDEPFLFYRDDPLRSSSYFLLWSGAAAQDEGPAIRRWLQAAMPGMPQRLAVCFAWHVTQARDM